MSQELVLDVHGLRRAYGNVTAVAGVDLAVPRGAIVGLVGGNGAGKTTTLLCLAGALAPDAGTIRINGHDLGRDPIEARRHLGFVPDEPQLFEYLTVEEHLQFMASLYDVANPGPIISELLDGLSLGERRHALPSTLSRGMRQKLALGCAFVHQPAMLLLDEPLTGLDPQSMRTMKDRIAASARNGGAVLLSSHQLSLVGELCTDVVVLRQGTVVMRATPDGIAGARAEAIRGLEDAVLELL